MSTARLAGFSAALAALLVAGMVWASVRMPHRVVDFRVKGDDWLGVAGVAVVPKLEGKLPVVLYLHGSGDSLERSTGTLRQFAELGLAAVCMDYTQTNAATFPAQFVALLSWVASQPWADTNRVAWVGFSLGAQRMLSHACAHPEAMPAFLVRLAGGRVPELEGSLLKFQGKAWLVQGEQDETFRVSDAEEVRKKLVATGMSVELTVLPGQSHAFGENRLVVLRRLAERCAEELGATRSEEGPP